ncbi:hypothetical protein DY000_02060913 [Brassica cretica]|uniref:Uncharacterized protein n=1 Tax=Brassica cretica TaxID=69181 RepID=A0ABQ7AR65_BRACR|nr:hypothetical protein DY000_02060913 [Brassica cretica]
MEAEDALDLLPASGSSGLKVENSGLESGSGSPESNLLVDIEERMGRDLDLVEEDLTTVGGEISAEQVIHVVAVDEKLRIHKETALDVSCILLLLEADSGVTRPQTVSDQQQPTVHVTFTRLTRASKQKLESLLQHWSEWEAEYTSQAQVSLNGEGHLLSS